MIVRMFKPPLSDLVKSGAKLQTIRPFPKRPLKIGDRISLRAWIGVPYRSNQCVLRESIIRDLKTCEISQHGNIYIAGKPAQKGFAEADGFRSECEFVTWVHEHYGLPFSGVVIYWE